MTNEVLITIRGYEYADGSWQEPVVTSARGKYIFRSGHHFISYEEELPEGGGNTKNLIKCGPGYLCVTRKGALSSRMEMDKRKRSLAVYDTPMGLLEFELEAGHLTLEETADRLELRAVYSLYARGEETDPLQKRKIELAVTTAPIPATVPDHDG